MFLYFLGGMVAGSFLTVLFISIVSINRKDD